MISDIEIDISKFILNRNLTRYSDLEVQFKISKPTISKYLSDISAFINTLDGNLTLVRNRKRGIYFEGCCEDFKKLLIHKAEWHPVTPKDRRNYILSSLLFKKSVTTIGELIEELFISQRTLENDLSWIREFVANNNGKLTNNSGTLKLVMSDDYLYAFMIYIFHDYWGDNIAQSDDKNVIFPPILQGFFNEENAKRIFKFVDKFLNHFKFRTTEYEYTSLIIYLLIQYTLFSNLTGIVKLKNLKFQNNVFEFETEYLSKNFEQEFNYVFTNDQKNFLNNFIILIKSENNQKVLFNNADEITRIKQVILDDNSKISVFDSQFLDGLSKHISLSIKRIRFGMKIRNPYTDNFKKSYPLAFENALELAKRLSSKFSLQFNDDEIAFIGMYFASLSERKEMVSEKTTAVIVCNTGIGTSRFLEEKIKQELSNLIEVKGITVTHELPASKINADIIISTVPLTDIKRPHVLVSPFLTQTDKNKILDLIGLVKKNYIADNVFKKLLYPNLVIFVDRKADYKNVLKQLINKAVSLGFVDDDIYQSALDREKLSSTVIGDTAIPHGETRYIKVPFIGIIKSKSGINWLGTEVQLAFFMGLRDIDSKSMKTIYHELNKIIENKKIMNKLIEAPSAERLIRYLEENNFD